MRDATRLALNRVFGSDSDSESTVDGDAVLQDLGGIRGLNLARAFDHSAQEALLRCISEEGWLLGGFNQAMRFGNLPAWAHTLISAFPKSLLPEKVAARRPLFDQLAANRYLRPTEGLKAHVDLHQFEDGICIVSLGCAAVMTFTAYQNAAPLPMHHRRPPSESAAWDGDALHVLLQPGDILALSGPARYDWMHGIQETARDIWNGQILEQGVRTSITLRKMCVD